MDAVSLLILVVNVEINKLMLQEFNVSTIVSMGRGGKYGHVG
jgi:hypothetical protein